MLLSFFMRSSTLSSSSADICPSLLISWEICWDVESKYYNKDDAPMHLGTSRETRVLPTALDYGRYFKAVLNHAKKADVSANVKALLVYLKAITFQKKTVGNHDPIWEQKCQTLLRFTAAWNFRCVFTTNVLALAKIYFSNTVLSHPNRSLFYETLALKDTRYRTPQSQKNWFEPLLIRRGCHSDKSVWLMGGVTQSWQWSHGINSGI